MASSSSSSSSSKPRSSSPFRFFKSSAAAQQGANVPSLTQVLEPAASSSSSSSSPGFNLGGQSHSMVNRSFAPNKSRTAPAASHMVGKFSSTSSASSVCSIPPPSLDSRVDFVKAKECVAVTIRFRPLSVREIQKGDEISWYADGDTIVRSEYNHQTAYAFDRVFGPATTTRAVYDSAARQVIRGAMEGVNGTVFAYGVTSSGKTHTMHGDQKSPGIIPLAVKDVFSFIQDCLHSPDCHAW